MRRGYAAIISPRYATGGISVCGRTRTRSAIQTREDDASERNARVEGSGDAHGLVAQACVSNQ